MTTAELVLILLAGSAALVAIAHHARAATVNPVADVLPVVWPHSATDASLNVTFVLRDCTTAGTVCTTVSLTSGKAPTFTLTARSAGALPTPTTPQAMVLCGGATPGVWCINVTVPFDGASGPYITYAGLVMWSTGSSPANVWSGESFALPAREVRLTSTIEEAQLPESRAHANATWESQAHANLTWCPNAPVGDFACAPSNYQKATFEGQSHANTTWESQAHANATWESQQHATTTWESRQHANATWESQQHANATWESQQHANATWESQPHANATWESQPHANATWCASPCGGLVGDFVGNPWFNNTFRPHAAFGSVTMTQLDVGTVTATDMTISGTMTTQTAWDPYVMPLVFSALIVGSTFAGLWIARQRSPVAKLAVGVLLIICAVWSGKTNATPDAAPFQYAAVLVTAVWALIVLWSIKDRR